MKSPRDTGLRDILRELKRGQHPAHERLTFFTDAVTVKHQRKQKGVLKWVTEDFDAIKHKGLEYGRYRGTLACLQYISDFKRWQDDSAMKLTLKRPGETERRAVLIEMKR